MRRAVHAVLVAAAALSAFAGGSVRANEALWSTLAAGGQVILMRHAITTPGTGDPDGMRLDDCATQRNLSDQGRKDAREVGTTFRLRGIPIGEVRASPWCRCLETARLAFGSALAEPALSNLFGRSDRADSQIRALKALFAAKPSHANRVFVTHGSTIAAVTGISPAPAELVIVTPDSAGNFRVVGRLQPLPSN